MAFESLENAPNETRLMNKIGCHCEADAFSKVYQKYQKHWWGTERAWTCKYTCFSSSDAKATIVIGSSKQNSIGSDLGNEGVCDGLIYESRLNPYTLWEDYTLVGQQDIYAGSKIRSPELKQWLTQNCVN
jgi:hypothetical protein